MPATIYSEELADAICAELMLGRSLRAICEAEPWAPGLRTVVDWLAKDVGDFRDRYARAREVQADMHADDLVDIADHHEIGESETDKLVDGTVFTEVKRADMIEHRKLRISTRQWNAEKLRPKVYGARQQIEHSGSVGVVLSTVSDDELNDRLLQMVTTGRLKLPSGATLVEVDEEPPPSGQDEDWSDIA